jgi:TolA-binding protein
MDWVQAGITAGVVVAGHVISYTRSAARNDKRMEDVEETQDKHEFRLGEHDDKFDQLGVKFVPRQELQETMGSIRESQKQMQRWLEALMLKRVRPIPIDDDP